MMLTVDNVLQDMGLVLQGDDLQRLTLRVAAVNTFITEKRPDVNEWSTTMLFGAIRLAVKWFQQVGSSDGQTPEFWGWSATTGDTDIDMLLGLGTHHQAVVA
jgi:hypothetical protein